MNNTLTFNTKANKIELGNQVWTSNTVKSVNGAGETCWVIKTVEQVKDGINKPIYGTGVPIHSQLWHQGPRR